jgi:hypothetical protein
MFKKRFTSISLATLAILGTYAMSVESAFARSGHGVSISFHSGGYRPWRHHHSWGLYGRTGYVSTRPYVLDCYYVRRYGKLFKVCE